MTAAAGFASENPARLGLNAKSAFRPARSDAKSNRIKALENATEKRVKRDIAESRRWSLQRAAARIMSEKIDRIDRNGETVQGFKYRVAMCHRGTHGPDPVIYRAGDGSRAEYRYLQKCGSVWMCPLCAAKITAERRHDLQAAMTAWAGQGGAVYLVTNTFQHTREDDIAGSVKALSAALSRWKGAKSYGRIMGAAGSVGAIRTTEVTFGEINGFHPHSHALLFAETGALDALGAFGRGSLRRTWCEILIKNDLAGLTDAAGRPIAGPERFKRLRALFRRAFDVRDGTHAAEYVAKYGLEPKTVNGGRWGPASEVARGPVKTSRIEGRATPFQLLADYLAGDGRSGRLFRDYAQAFHGRRQLFWSPKLRERLGLGAESDDADVANRDDVACDEVALIMTGDDWRVVLSHDARFDLLLAAAEGPAQAVAFMEGLRRRPRRTHSGEYQSNDTAFIQLRMVA